MEPLWNLSLSLEPFVCVPNVLLRTPNILQSTNGNWQIAVCLSIVQFKSKPLAYQCITAFDTVPIVIVIVIMTGNRQKFFHNLHVLAYVQCSKYHDAAVSQIAKNTGGRIAEWPLQLELGKMVA